MAEVGALRTGLLLLEGQLLPVGLHAIPQRHPQVGLLLRGHVLPALLDVGKGRVGDGMSLAKLLLGADGGRSGSGADSLACRGRWDERSRAPRGPDNGGAQHDG